ncbi:acylneuraminate cytidylyltransferase family protein [Vibrio parahaemolyticus]|uniref:acylneuraminate cytidylyltransferase family protein n=2 Tax=Vibrio parahaemolyticus TaxID=670 RepID=UPI001121E583|nr:acylneuraminate cytidylyltransferase family protein [Vibrio parahaemolyticus]TOK78025.1 CMP-N-acetlyneuraminic acid synthetase [Vibrio parahaemolyticus]TOK82344.1 CMP-N-acetlyneuraminic acid synthetase [Vibrio parahaemolyticus]
MIGKQKVIAIIPARGGSKRLPRKNVLNLAGKPLISWTIDAAKECKYIDEILVSTDDREISNIALQHGVHMPELRPSHLSSDSATTESLLLYCLEQYEIDANIIVLLQPTSPLRSALDIEKSLEYYIEKSAKSVVTVTQCEHSPLWANILPEDFNMGRFIPEKNTKRSQELPVFYRLNGAIYIFDIDTFKVCGMKYSKDSYAYLMDNESSIDIDTELDFKFADFLLNERVSYYAKS